MNESINIYYLFFEKRNKSIKISNIDFVELKINNAQVTTVVLIYEKEGTKTGLDVPRTYIEVLEILHLQNIPIYMEESMAFFYKKRLVKLEEKGINIKTLK